MPSPLSGGICYAVHRFRGRAACTGTEVSLSFSESLRPGGDHYGLVVDDHPLVAHGMAAFLRLHKKLDDAVSAGSPPEALRTIAQRGAPAIALVDFWLADGATDLFVRDVLALAPSTRVLMVSGDSHPAIVLKVRASGAHGFVHKQEAPEALAAAVSAVLDGGTWFDAAPDSPPAVADTPLAREVPLAPSDLGLTPRQGEILALLLQGLPNKPIAAALNVSEHTVKEHVTAILHKLQARNRVEAIAKLRGVRLEVPPAHYPR